MLTKLLERSINWGRLTVIESNGTTTVFGERNLDRPKADVVVRLKGSLTPFKLALRPDLYLGEAYVDGTLVIEQGTLWDLLDLCGRNSSSLPCKHDAAGQLVMSVARWLQQYNPKQRAKKNAAHHYDLSPALYRTFLDHDLQYSCAYFTHERASLDEAQRAKKRHIASKLLLRPGNKILDIGCGWGGLALFLAEAEDVEVTGVTLSQEQLKVARQRARERGLQGRVKFELMDYRAIEGRFDRIVSVGMFEHVGTPHYQLFFRRLASLLAERGVALIHSIGRMHGPSVTNSWIRKYIFPGGYIPALSQVMPAVEASGLWLTDLEILKGHYAETLRHWRQNFLSRTAEVGKVRDEQFCRMWEFYLAVSEMAFRYGGMMVFHAQLARAADSVPSTRDYMFEYERGLDAFGPEAMSRVHVADYRADLSQGVQGAT